VNDLVSKNNTNNRGNHHHNHHHNRRHHRGGGGNNRDNNDTYDCISYSIPSPRSFNSDQTQPFTVGILHDIEDTINLDNYNPNDNGEFSDSVESVESDSAMNDTYVNNPLAPQNNPDRSPTRRNIAPYDPGMSPVYDLSNQTINIHSGGRREREHHRRDRPRAHRARSRSPHAIQQQDGSGFLGELRRPGQQLPSRNENNDGVDDGVILRIGVSQTVSDSSTSSSSSTDSDTD